MTGESGFRTFLCQQGPDCVQREAGGAEGLPGGLLRKAAVECACIGQPADGTERLFTGFLGEPCAEKERCFKFFRIKKCGRLRRPADGLAAAGIADNVNDIAQNGAGRRRAACAGAGEHDRADAAAQHFDGVQNAGDGSKRLRARNEMR